MNLKKILQFSIGPVVGAALGLISVPVVTWFFSAEDIGRLSMLQVAISFSLILCGLGLDQAYVREYHESEDRPALLKGSLLPGLLILVLLLLLLSLLPFSISKLLFGIESVYLSALLFFGVFTSFVSRFLSLILRMSEQGLAYSLSQVFPKLIYLAIIGLYVCFAFSAVSENLILAYVSSQLIALLIFAWATREEWGRAIVARIDRQKLCQMISYGFPLVGSGLAFWGLTATDKFFLRTLSSFEELGVYAVAISFSGVALILQAIFSVVWAPTIYKWVAEGVDPARIKKIVDYVVLGVMIIWSMAGLLSFLVAYILPSEYKAVEFMLVTAMAYPLLYTMSEATGVGVGIQRKTIYTMLATFLALAINIILNYLLIPEYGAAGAAISSALAFMAFFIIRTEVSAKVWKSFPRLAMYGVIMLALAVSIVGAMPMDFIGKRLIWGAVLVVALIVYRGRLADIFGLLSVKRAAKAPSFER